MKKKYGLGTGSLILCVLAFVWSFNVPSLSGMSVGDCVLSFLGIPVWSGYIDGNMRVHYTLLFSLLFLIPALVLSITHKNDWGAKVGMWVSGTVTAYTAIMTFAAVIF